MNKPGLTSVLLAAFVLGSWVNGAGAEGSVQTLRGADAATADQAPAEKTLVGKRPGRQQPIQRTFEGQPPLIPHALQNFDEITFADNQCLSCHDEANFEKKAAPMIGKSHFDPAVNTTPHKVDNSRWFCMQCHVPQYDAPPLVVNEFPVMQPPAGAAPK